jgi:hypothetical protein
MHLLDERIEDPNAIAALKSLFHHLAADKSGATGDEDGLGHRSARSNLQQMLTPTRRRKHFGRRQAVPLRDEFLNSARCIPPHPVRFEF